MFRVFGCVFEQHDLLLVALAGLLCIFASTAAMTMVRHAAAAAKPVCAAWLTGAGVVAGSGIWGTHFVAMLAYQAGVPVAYDVSLTLLSAAIAIAMCGVGFAIALSLRPAIGGAVVGAAIGAMHSVGMAAVHLPADAMWDWRHVAASVAIGTVLTSLAMDVALRRGTATTHAVGALLLTLAICGMHFTGMSAVSYRFDPLIVVPHAVLEPSALAIAVAATVGLIVALGLTGTLVDSYLASRDERERRRLRTYVAELEATKAALENTSVRLAAALCDAASADQAKSAFLAAMSHELRTPLNAVIGFSEMLAAEPFGPLGNARYREYANDIHASGTHLLSLINDILDLSRIESGDDRLEDSEIDPRDIVGECLRMVGTQATACGLALTVDIETGIPHIRGDARRLKQILINLLANAVKFTPAGGTIAVRVARRLKGIVLVVEDTGIGIAPQDIPRVLVRFRQVDSTLARKYEGAGLGLPLARQLAERHGGTLTLESQIGVGTTVTVTLPAERVVEIAFAA